jgi:hypothetical protein
MKINFLSNDFENYLLNKLDITEITEENLNSIEEISLNAIGNNGIKNNYDFRDFNKLPNLKFISLQNFTIKNYETNAINRCANLEGLQFAHCIIKSKSRLQGNLEIISFDQCKNLHFKYISILKNLKILKFSNILFLNLKNIGMLKNIEKIYFENGRIFNFKELANLKKLLYIRIVKCKWNKSQEKFLNENIEIEK